MTVRISVDFNTMMTDPEERVYINTDIDPHLLECLQPGLSVVLYDGTLEVEADAEFDERQEQWRARPRWSTSRDLAYAPMSGEGGRTGD